MINPKSKGLRIQHPDNNKYNNRHNNNTHSNGIRNNKI